VVHAYDAGRKGRSHYYLAMEYVEGPDLARLVKRRGALPAAVACAYARQAALGLEHAHGRGVVHRDLKPSNLLLSARGVVKVLDLGLARLEGAGEALTRAGQVLGTVDYIAPEQALGAGADARSDLYSLGCTLHFLLAGRPPFPGGTAADKLLRHLREEPQAPEGVPASVVEVARRLMAKRPEGRYRSAAEAAEALGRIGGLAPA
jgi:serine/threonine protein kinase